MSSLNDINRGDQLLQSLGSFWAVIFGNGNGQLRDLMRADSLEDAQTHLDFLETVACVSRFTVPVFHQENWHLLTIKLSEVNGVASIYRPDDLVYGPQPFGGDRPEGFVQTYGGRDKPGIVQVPMPDNLIDVKFDIQNYVLVPSKVWVFGIDFDIDRERKLIVFRNDPFNDPMVPHRDVFDANGVKTDEEIALWVYRGEFDLNYVYIQFGYALGLRLASSEFYKQLLNAYWDMHLLGPSVEQTRVFLSALAGAPMVKQPREVVEVIRTESTSILIVTDLSVYRVPLTANVVVAVGDVVFAGAPLTDAIQLFEFSQNTPDYSILPMLPLSKQFLSGNYLSELSFKNHRVDLEYKGLDASGKAVVQFEVSGYPGDVELFWNTAQTIGSLPGNKTLAELLDRRTDPVGQPLSVNLPAKINPLEFVLANLFKNNLFVIKVRTASFDASAPGVQYFSLLRDVLPPHVTYVVYIELAALSDSIDLSQAGDDSTPGVEESISTFAAAVVSEEAYEVHMPSATGLTYGDYAVTVRYLSLNCQ